jgi:uncharacterized phage protein gp47/JayE
MGSASPELRQAIEALIAAIMADEQRNGGLLSRSTIRAADELRLLLSRKGGA